LKDLKVLSENLKALLIHKLKTQADRTRAGRNRGAKAIRSPKKMGRKFGCNSAAKQRMAGKV
jgi:hypothetical protein